MVKYLLLYNHKNCTTLIETKQGLMNMEKPTQAGEFCWNELATTNVQEAKKFYNKVFGWEFTDHEMGDMTYTMIKHHEKEFAGIWSIPKDKEKEITPHWLSYIFVDNLDQAIEKAEKHGASIVKPASNAGEMGRFAIITDPIGAHIALWQPLS
jgi:predicted enzyme related to lactoylglutathione lyase